MMKRYLIVKLLAVNLVVVGFAVVVVWVAIDTLAASYFVTLMEKYHISPEPAHAMFVDAVHRYLIWAFAGAIGHRFCQHAFGQGVIFFRQAGCQIKEPFHIIDTFAGFQKTVQSTEIQACPFFHEVDEDAGIR